MDEPAATEASDDVDAYYRVRVDMPIRVTLVEAEDLAELKTAILSCVDEPVPDLEPALIAWLDRIERKLDRLLAANGMLDAPPLCQEEPVEIELSAAGIALEPPMALRPADVVLLEFELPEVPVRLVRCIGRVVEAAGGANDPKSRTDLRFETIRPSDRDAVVRYTLVVQRQAIRSQNAARSGPA